MSGIDMQEAALDLIQDRGFRVFPLHSLAPNGQCTCRNSKCDNMAKHPIYQKGELEHGCKDATELKYFAARWWERWPFANIGLSTDRLCVIDVDLKGQEAWGKLSQGLPPTLTSRTGSGGWHVIYFQPPGTTMGNNRGKLPRGIDVRGTGGYIVAPPSLHRTGNRYCWIDPSHPIGQLPPDLMEVLRPVFRFKKDSVFARKGGPVTIDGPPIGDGERNSTLFRIACSLANVCQNQDEITQNLILINDARCSPPLPVDEVRRIASNAASYL